MATSFDDTVQHPFTSTIAAVSHQLGEVADLALWTLPAAETDANLSALAALRHAPELLGRVDDLRAERDATVTWLRAQGFEVADSDANFVLFGRFADRHAVWQGLVERGVLIRETGPDGWLRVSVGTPEEMAAFRQALLDTTDTTEDPA